MLFFAQATAHQGGLLPVVLNTSANLKAWATLDPTNGEVNIAIINKDKSASGSVQLTVPGYQRGLVSGFVRAEAGPPGVTRPVS